MDQPSQEPHRDGIRAAKRGAGLLDQGRRHAESAEWVNAMLAGVADAGNTGSNLEILYALATVVAGFLGAAITYVARKRVTAGRVSTSDADVLWQQSQAMRDMLLKEKELAESQRDKMIEINGQLLPMLESINSSLVDIFQIVRGKNERRNRGDDVGNQDDSGDSSQDRPAAH
jgi:hypothetical protein